MSEKARAVLAVYGEATESLLAEAEAELVKEATQ